MKKNSNNWIDRHRYVLKKALMAMKLTTFIFLVSTFSLLASGTYSQNTRISLDMKNAQIKEVLLKIENSSEFFFIYNNQLVDVDRTVTVKANDERIKDILVEIFSNQQVEFQVADRKIVIVPSVISSNNVQQQKSVSGKVSDSSGGSLPGASVVVKGTTTGVITDMDGKYTILKVPENATLQFSFVGMKPQEIIVAGKSVINVVLVEDAIGLEEVVAIGYGTSKKADLTGSIVSADLNQFKESPNSNILQSLQGSLPGITIGQVASAGAEPSISIRGKNTLSGNESPLVVVDGIIYRGRLSDINPNDIQSVDVLKDPSSKAIYGAQAANGIVMVTTKTGKKNQKTEIRYSGFYSIQNPIKSRRNLNREEFLQAGREADYKNGFTGPDYTTPNTAWNYGQVAVLGSVAFAGFNDGTDFNWYNATTNNNSYNTDHQLSIRGGSENTSFFVSGGYADALGWVINDNYTRKTARINIDTKLQSWLTMGISTSGAFSDFSGQSPNLGSLPVMTPLVQPKNADGDYIYQPLDNGFVNPFIQVQADDRDRQNNISALVYASIDVPYIKGLNYRVNYSNNYRWSLHDNSDLFGAGLTGSAYKNNSNTLDVSLDNILTYEKRFGATQEHKIKATMVVGYNTNEYAFTKASSSGFTNLATSYNSLQQGVLPLVESSAWKESFISQTGRINYDYRSKYLLSASIRRDGFSGFAANHKTALFPSFGLGWIMNEESFLKNSQIIDLLKLRGSYGVNGNITSRYSSLARFSSNIGTAYLYDGSQYVFGDGAKTETGVYVSTLANKDLKWELTKGLNVGFDFGILKNRISGNVDFYSSKTNDLLWDLVLPIATGFSSIKSNIGEIQNTGVEVVLNFNPVKTKNFNWDLGVNFAKNTNKINKLLGQDKNGDGKEDDLVVNGLFIGKSIGSVYTYVKEGIYQIGETPLAGFSVGGYKFKDISGPDGTPDGKISAEYDKTIIGRSEPDYQIGITNNFTYKAFSFKFFITSIQGGIGMNEPWNDPNGFYGKTSTVLTTNRFNDIDSWSPSNPNAKYSLPGITSPVSFSPYQDRSFIRLQDVSFSYNLTKELLSKAGINDLKFFISGKNLLTFTKWDGWDPETGAGLGISNSGLPVMKSITLGVEVAF